ncbi:MAG: hypothetical protein E7241_01610 [Lachnospiraceae bacterium]|nr:hypothetical protein [Lachnospiraceae bacterium]
MYTVDGFDFKTQEEAEAAEKEVQAVKYIRERIAGISPEKAVDVYNRLVREEMLSTPVGIAYLRELREELKVTPGVDKNKLLVIKIKDDVVVKEISARTDNQVRPMPMPDKKNYKGKFRNSLIINLILVLAVFAMFFIAMTSDNPNIINYENNIINKYEEWQKDLEQREERILEYEKKYNLNSYKTS